MLTEKRTALESQVDDAISYDACHTAHQLGAVVIVAFTKSGSTARRVSKYRPKVPILAITPSEEVRHRLALVWGVYPFAVTEPSSVDELFAQGTKLAKETSIAKEGDLMVITAGIPIGVPGTTNLLKVEKIS
jgi:pyruvate kinase